MHARQRDNARVELRALVVVISAPETWQRAQDVAVQIGTPWRKVAFALRRLARRGYVAHEIVSYKGRHRSKEYTSLYRAVPDRQVANDFKARYLNWIKC